MSTKAEAPLPDAHASAQASAHTRAASSARNNAGERQLSNHGRTTTPITAAKHARWILYLACLLRRTPGPTATTQRPIHPELARGLWQPWSSCCSSHRTCPRRLKHRRPRRLQHRCHRCLMRMHQRTNPTHTTSIIGTQQRRRTAVVKSRPHNNTNHSCQTCTLVPIPASPPAKNIRPDGNDAAAKRDRACPRPVGNVAQLLLVASYMST